MFGFASRKEIEKLESQIGLNSNLLFEEMTKLTTRISQLEAANNCRDGKHEWGEKQDTHTRAIQQTNRLDFVTIDVGKPYQACKHCGIKKDEWEKKENRDAKRKLKVLMNTPVPWSRKPQPKRKKGKK